MADLHRGQTVPLSILKRIGVELVYFLNGIRIRILTGMRHTIPTQNVLAIEQVKLDSGA